jgi:hypothetical protein
MRKSVELQALGLEKDGLKISEVEGAEYLFSRRSLCG